MPKLTSREEKFAQGVANGLSQAEAYRQANQASSKWLDKTIWEKASRMAGKVEARINEIRAELAKKSLWSRMDSVETLKTIANSTEKGGDKIAAVKDGDKIAAVKVLNEMHGYNAPIKTEVKHEGEITHEIRPKLTRDEWLRIHGL